MSGNFLYFTNRVVKVLVITSVTALDESGVLLATESALLLQSHFVHPNGFTWYGMLTLYKFFQFHTVFRGTPHQFIQLSVLFTTSFPQFSLFKIKVYNITYPLYCIESLPTQTYWWTICCSPINRSNIRRLAHYS